jgi:perosamine synthetase
MQAATGLVQLRKLDWYLEARRRNAAYLSERLGDPSTPPASQQATLRTGVDGIQAPFVAEYATHSYYKYIGRLRPETGIDIARFVQAVAAEGIPISRRYPTPLPQQPVFRGLDAGACPTAERLSGELFTLLVHPTVETADLDDVVEAIRKVRQRMGSE